VTTEKEKKSRAGLEEFMRALLDAQEQNKEEPREYAQRVLNLKPLSFDQRFRREHKRYPEAFAKYIKVDRFKGKVGRSVPEESEALRILERLQGTETVESKEDEQEQKQEQEKTKQRSKRKPAEAK
jgi:hypothetical protein